MLKRQTSSAALTRTVELIVGTDNQHLDDPLSLVGLKDPMTIAGAEPSWTSWQVLTASYQLVEKS